MKTASTPAAMRLLIGGQAREAARLGHLELLARRVHDLLEMVGKGDELIAAVLLHHAGNHPAATAKADDAGLDPAVGRRTSHGAAAHTAANDKAAAPAPEIKPRRVTPLFRMSLIRVMANLRRVPMSDRCTNTAGASDRIHCPVRKCSAVFRPDCRVSVSEYRPLQERSGVCSVPVRAYSPWAGKRTPYGVTTNETCMQGA